MRHARFSSMFIFHKDNTLRKFCMSIAESPENLVEFTKLDKEGKLESYANDNQNKAAAIGMFTAAKAPNKG
jgi:hypothetical protein